MAAVEGQDIRDPRDILREMKFKVLGQAVKSNSSLSYTERTDQPYTLFPVEPYADPLTRFSKQFDEEIKSFLKTVNEKESRRHDDERRAHARKHLDQVNRDYDLLGPDTLQQRKSNRIVDFISTIIRKARFWLVRPSLQRQQGINAEFVRFCNAMMEVIDESIYHQRSYNDQMISIGDRFLKVIVTMQETRDRLKHQWDIQHLHFEESIRSILDGVLLDLTNLRQAIIQSGLNLESRNKERISIVHANLKTQQAHISALADGLQSMLEQTPDIGSDDKKRVAKKVAISTNDHEQSYFTDEFRGSYDDIMERQRHYLLHFRECHRVLDIGSGRGEFLELLRREGIQAEGLEQNAAMVTLCRERGLVVHELDAVTFLDNCEEGQYDGIFAAQVIEHIPSEDRSAFITRCQRVLRPGGCFLVETVNPLSLFALTHNFFVDPTHREPVHPETLLFQMRLTGFTACELHYIHPVAESQRLSSFNHPEGQSDTLTLSLNNMVTKLNEMLFGFQDYVIIAKKTDKK